MDWGFSTQPWWLATLDLHVALLPMFWCAPYPPDWCRAGVLVSLRPGCSGSWWRGSVPGEIPGWLQPAAPPPPPPPEGAVVLHGDVGHVCSTSSVLRALRVKTLTAVGGGGALRRFLLEGAALGALWCWALLGLLAASAGVLYFVQACTFPLTWPRHMQCGLCLLSECQDGASGVR